MTQSDLPADEAACLRLLTYNVRSLRDDPTAVSRVIRLADPHVVCIQEAPRMVRWRAKCAALARRSGMVVVTGGRTAAGNLILCSLGVDVPSRRDVVLSPIPGLHERGAALASLRWRGHDFAVAATHLDLEAQARQLHIAELNRRLDEFREPSAPAVVAGDINDVPGSPAWLAIASGRTDAFSVAGEGDGFTFSAREPRRRIDGVFVSDAIRVISARVLDGADVVRGSDHRPVLVELSFAR